MKFEKINVLGTNLISFQIPFQIHQNEALRNANLEKLSRVIKHHLFDL